MSEDNMKPKCFTRDNWVIPDNGDKDAYYNNIRQSLREMGVLEPAKNIFRREK